MSTSPIFVVIIMNHPVYNAVVVHWTCPNDVRKFLLNPQKFSELWFVPVSSFDQVELS